MLDSEFQKGGHLGNPMDYTLMFVLGEVRYLFLWIELYYLWLSAYVLSQVEICHDPN